MSNGYKVPTHKEIREDLNALLELPDRIDRFDKGRLKEILIFLESEIQIRLNQINNTLLSCEDNYKYPIEYLPDKQYVYWAERTFQYGLTIYDLENSRKWINEKIFIAAPVQPILKEEFPYPFRSKEGYDGFLEYKSKYIIDPYTDFSYLYHRLKHFQFIYYMPQIEFGKWLLENQYVSEKTFEKIDSNRGFVSPKNSYSVNRMNNFKIVFDLI
jgi:hypothetical protein